MITKLFIFFAAIRRWLSPNSSRPISAVDAVTAEIQRIERVVAEMMNQAPAPRSLAPAWEPISEYQKIRDLAG